MLAISGDGWNPPDFVMATDNQQWSMHAFDPTEMPADGKRSREWTAVGRSELHCLRVMARCLGEIRAGRWPR